MITTTNTTPTTIDGDNAITPEAHHDRLAAEIEHELRTYGVQSLAAVIATMLEDDDRAREHARFSGAFRRIERTV